LLAPVMIAVRPARLMSIVRPFPLPLNVRHIS
jgi:hypothetical protein